MKFPMEVFVCEMQHRQNQKGIDSMVQSRSLVCLQRRHKVLTRLIGLLLHSRGAMRPGAA